MNPPPELQSLRTPADETGASADHPETAPPSGAGTADTVVGIFRDQLAIEIPAHDTDLIDSGLLDSLAMVSLIVQIEAEFGFAVAIDELDIEDFRSAGKIAAYIDRQIA